MRSERARLVHLTVLVTLTSGLASLLHGPAFWLGALLVAGLTAVAALSFLGPFDPRGIPIESLATPAAAAFGTVGAAHLVGPGVLAIPVLAAGGFVVGAALFLEASLVGFATERRPRREGQLVPLLVLIAFASFAGVAGEVYGSFEDRAQVIGTLVLEDRLLLVLAFADALIAFVLGYRLAGLRAVSVKQALRSAGTFAAVVGAGAGLTRAIALPQIVGPALLAGIFYAWSAYRAASGGEQRTRGWIWEYLVLGAAMIAAVAWNVLVR